MRAVAILHRTRDLLPLLRLSPFDTATPDGRAKERMRGVVLTALASALAKLISIATSLISVPLVLHYLGAERYGLWLTISSVAAMLAFADFGIGNGVVSAVSTAHGRQELTAIRAYVSSAYALLTAIAVALLALIVVLYSVVDWAALFNVQSPLARAEVGPAVSVFIASFAFALPLSVVQRVQFASQMGFMTSLWQCGSSVAGLFAMLLAVHFEAGLPWLVAAVSGVPMMIGVVNTLVFFGRVRPEFAPRRSAISRRHGAEIAQLGVLFFVLQLAVAVMYASDNFVIAHILGAEHVPQYAVPDRLFALTSTVVGFAVAPLWPAFAEAIARGDHVWARRTLIRATILSGLVGGGCCLVLLLTGKTILHLWVGDTIAPSFALLAGFAVWRTLEAMVGPASMYLNGLRAVRFQVTTAIMTCLVVIGLEIVLIRPLGVAALPWVTAIAYSCLTLVPVIFLLHRKFSAETSQLVGMVKA